MTTAIFLLLFFAFFVGALNWLPVADSTDSILLDGFEFFIGTMKDWNWFFPITELLYCVGIIVAYEIAVWAWFKVLVPVLRITRGGTS